MISRLLYYIALFISQKPKWFVFGLLFIIVGLPFVGIVGTKIYQNMDQDESRGAIAVSEVTLGESYTTPEYLAQGWKRQDSLWFYNTTQGSDLLPYDFLLALEQPEGTQRFECERNGENGPWFLCDENIDYFRYLPQKDTLFNPDALPVGFVKDTYQGMDYVGYTCAACHTAQVNYKGRALRIDGGPAMADMVDFLTSLTTALKETQRVADQENPRLDRFVERVLAMDNDYSSAEEIEADLEKWVNIRSLYNIVNRSTYENKRVRYGYARLDAFGRIFNRVLQHTINHEQVETTLKLVTVKRNGVQQRVLTDAEVDKVLADVRGETILTDEEFWKILVNLQSDQPGYPNLGIRDLLRVRDKIFNPANAPVSYPFLWDITRADYVQWNALASNAAIGPLGRNAGEVTGVFATLDWHEQTGFWAEFSKFSLPAFISGQTTKGTVINFKSSIDLFNLQRLESHLVTLESPRWPFCRAKATGEYYLPTGVADSPVDERECAQGDHKLDAEKIARGQVIYADKCQSCHDVIVRDDWNRKVVSNMVGIDHPETTDDAMAANSASYLGNSGNFKDTYQDVGVGKVIVRESAPVAQILTAATRGTVTTPDPDKWWPRRFVEWVYALVMTLFDNPVKASMKAGEYMPDTTAQPYNSLKAYRARSLNGIWATAPYLHNGSVPSLYELLLPKSLQDKEGNDRGCTSAAVRTNSFMVGAREFDPIKVGFLTEGYNGFRFDTSIRGNQNIGHEYGACKFSEQDRWDLIEYLKSL
ncbi:hypothetical protein WH96_04790 [Kiloniella spongiae]|uniref:Cytochrome c domain-containing protein n=1 Tax=Kiloniella spongiae TaxID=1489064 RepID=A0A0H2MGY7_9PROT|nr:di-heme-cytochrome C peroxidase [Kiloniella spongiae]KLN61658.1 hypothetical protein WH96_04790 [Kiloniella spongiae]